MFVDIRCTVIYGMHQCLMCEREPFNHIDRYTVAVLKTDIVVGHLQKMFSRIYSLFLARGDTISCIITGEQRYSHDLPQGGLEFPCKLLFTGKSKEINKLKRLFTHKTTE